MNTNDDDSMCLVLRHIMQNQIYIMITLAAIVAKERFDRDDLAVSLSEAAFKTQDCVKQLGGEP